MRSIRRCLIAAALLLTAILAVGPSPSIAAATATPVPAHMAWFTNDGLFDVAGPVATPFGTGTTPNGVAWSGDLTVLYWIDAAGNDVVVVNQPGYPDGSGRPVTVSRVDRTGNPVWQHTEGPPVIGIVEATVSADQARLAYVPNTLSDGCEPSAPVTLIDLADGTATQTPFGLPVQGTTMPANPDSLVWAGQTLFAVHRVVGAASCEVAAGPRCRPRTSRHASGFGCARANLGGERHIWRSGRPESRMWDSGRPDSEMGLWPPRNPSRRPPRIHFRSRTERSPRDRTREAQLARALTQNSKGP